MWLHQKQFKLGAFFALLLLIIGASFAQTAIPPTSVPPPYDRMFFTLGGRTDNVILYAKTNQADILDVQEALIASFRVYQPLIGNAAGDTTGLIPFQVVVWISGLDSTEVRLDRKSVLADAGLDGFAAMPMTEELRAILEPEVCQIRVFNKFKGDKDHLATIAHEFSHCYQNYYNRLAFEAVNAEYSDWWSEGSAEWLSSLVYPEGFPSDLSEDFRYDLDTLRVGYPNFYFWLFAATPQGAGSNEDAASFMLGVPESSDEHAGYLDGINPDQDGSETFHQWMLALVNNRIPYNPPIDAPGFTQESALSGTVNLSTLRFSGDRVKILDVQVDPGNRAVVTASALGDSNYAVSGKIGGTWVRLEDDEAVEFCPEAGVLELVVSRALSSQDDRTEFTLTFDQAPSPTPCQKVPDEDENTACIAGTWLVEQYPVSIAIEGATVDTSDFTFTFGTDGTLEIFYGITASIDGMVMRADVPFSGTYAVKAGEIGTLEVSEFTAKIVAGGTYTATQPGGSPIDMTAPFYEYSQVFDPWGPVGEIKCEGDEMSWETEDGMGMFYLVRTTP